MDEVRDGGEDFRPTCSAGGKGTRDDVGNPGSRRPNAMGTLATYERIGNERGEEDIKRASGTMLPMSEQAPSLQGEQAVGTTRARSRANALRSRSVMMSYLGAVVRRRGDWMPIGGTVELMAHLGLDGPSVRTVVSRLKKRGWLDSEVCSGTRGYRLTSTALAALAEGDAVIWHARQPAAIDQGWCIVNFSVPESLSNKRHQLRSHLAAYGFGNVGTAMWIAPARMRDAAEHAIQELDLGPYSAVFVGDYVGGQDLAALLYRSWDLAGIDRRYRHFIAEFGPAATEFDGTTVGSERAFVTYLEVVDGWRHLPFKDPGLPRELLAEDWSGPAAASLFERLVGILEPPALAYAALHWPASPAS